METQKMTASAVKEITRGKQAGAATGEAQLTPEQEFARILGALFSGQPVAQADAFDALRAAPQLAVAEQAPVKEEREPREIEERAATDSTETEECEHSLGDEEAAPEAEKAMDDDAVKVEGLRVEAVKVDAAASVVESAASSTPSSPEVEQAAVEQTAVAQAAAVTAAPVVQQDVAAPDAAVVEQAATQASADPMTVQAHKRASVQQGKAEQANAQGQAQSQAETAQVSPEAVKQVQEQGGEPEAELNQDRTQAKFEAKPVQSKAEPSTSNSRIGLEPNGVPGQGGVIPGSEQAASASAGRADHAALSATQGARSAGQPAAMPQAGIDGIAGKASAQSSGNAAQAFGMGQSEETGKKNTSAAKETAKTAAKTQVQIIEQIQKALETAAKSKDGNTMIVRLDPPELGTLTVKITQRADQLFARIIPETPEVEQTLRDRAAEMTQVLAANGFRTENVQISIGMERSESESFYFNLPEQGSRGRKESEGSARRESAEHLPLVDAAAIESQARMIEAGWVA